MAPKARWQAARLRSNPGVEGIWVEVGSPREASGIHPETHEFIPPTRAYRLNVVAPDYGVVVEGRVGCVSVPVGAVTLLDVYTDSPPMLTLAQLYELCGDTMPEPPSREQAAAAAVLEAITGGWPEALIGIKEKP